MADVQQIYTILNAVAKQQYGSGAITVVDTSTMISLGNAVLSSDTDKDAFVNTLVDRIGRTVFSVRKYAEVDENVVKHPFDYGIILQKIYVALPDLVANTSWEIGEEDFVPEYAPVIKPDIRQKLFNALSTFEAAVTVPDNILSTAFTSEAAMGVLIDGIFTAIDNRITVALEACVNLVRAAFIARKINDAKPCGAINLLTQYNAAMTKTLKAQDALSDSAFLKWASMMINLWCRRMRKMSVLFNDEGYQRHTPAEDLVLTVLDDFATATASYLEADTYHRELVSLPRYNTVSYWQGSGTEYDFEDVSTINVTIPGTSAPITVKQSGVIALAYDYQALGATINRRNKTTERNNRAEYTNYYSKIERGYFNDMSENGIVFYIADTDAVPGNQIKAKSK